MAERSLSRFTPINPNGSMLQFIDPMKTPRYPNESEPHRRLLDSHGTSDTDSRGSGVLDAKSRKKRNKSVMLELFQEGLDEIDGPSKKKKKSVVQQRSISPISATRLSQLVVEEAGFPSHEDGEIPLAPLDSKLKAKGKSRTRSKVSQKNLSPKSKGKKQAPFQAPKITKPLLVEKDNSLPASSRSLPVSNHPNLTTTENAIKSKPPGVLLSKTTMSKLHSFLYVPSSLHAASAPPRPAQATRPGFEQRPNSIEHAESAPISSGYGPDYDNVILAPCREDTDLVRADRTVGMYHRYSPDMPSAYAMLSEDETLPGEASWEYQNHEDQALDHTQTRYQNGRVVSIERYDDMDNVVPTYVKPPISLPSVSVQSQLSHEEPVEDLPVATSGFDEPSSSDAKAFGQLMDQLEHLPGENPVIHDKSTAPGKIQRGAHTSNQIDENRPVQHDVVFKPTTNRPTTEEQNHDLFPPFTQNTYREVEDEESGLDYYKTGPHLRTGEVMLFDNQKTTVMNQFEDGASQGSSSDEPATSEGVGFKDGFDGEAILLDQSMHSVIDGLKYQPDDEAMLLDDYIPSEIEFGDGFGPEAPQFDDQIPPEIEFGSDIDDEAMLFDDHPNKEKAVFEETTPSEFDEFDDGLDDSDLLEIWSADTMMGVTVPSLPNRDDMYPNTGSQACADAVQQVKTIATPQIALPTSASPQMIDVDTDDEFPMDKCDEEDMLRLPSLIPNTYHLGLSPPRLQGHRCSGSSEVYGSTPQLSPHKSLYRTPKQTQSSPRRPAHTPLASSQAKGSEPTSDNLGEGEAWAHRSTDKLQVIDLTDAQLFENSDEVESEIEQLMPPPLPKRRSEVRISVRKSPATLAPASKWKGPTDHEPLQSFARPDFPDTVRDRCPVIGLSGQNFLRTCFKIGEMFKEGKRCSSFGQDAIIELFARVTFSSREAGTTKQYFVFADLWRDNPPFPEGMLMNYKTTGLADTESKAFVDAGEPKMARCLGRLKRDAKNATGWLLHIITIRETDWEEIRYTKKAVCAGEIKSESK